MRRLLLLHFLLELILLHALPAKAGPEARVACFDADVLEISLDEGCTKADGNASFSYGTLTLYADHVTADRSTGEVEARGDLEVTQGGRLLEGESLRYNLRTEEGVLTNARVAEQGVFVRGERIAFSASRIVAHNASFTTCDDPDPHYSFAAGTISLTAESAAPGRPPESGRLTLDHARVTYRNRRLFSLPRYSVSVGRLREPGGTPLPVTGFSREDGPYASISYTLGDPEDPTLGDLSYRYTTLRGIRGHVQLRRTFGPLELVGGYVRREDPSDRDLRADDPEASLADVLLNRDPEYGVRLADFPVGRAVRCSADWLSGSYTEWIAGEEEARARADRAASTVVLSVDPYPISGNVSFGHAFGLRRATYSPGGRYTVRLSRHSAELALSPRARLSLAYVARRSSGETPFLFDGRGPGRELLAELECQVTAQWGFRALDLYDIAGRRARDMVLEVTRTAHCLAYTVGWRKSRGRLYLRVGLAPVGNAGMP